MAYAVLGWRRATAWLGVGCAGAAFVADVLLATAVSLHGPRTVLGGQLRVDALSAFMLIVIGAVTLLATAASPAYLSAEISAGRASTRTARLHSLLVQGFVASLSRSSAPSSSTSPPPTRVRVALASPALDLTGRRSPPGRRISIPG
jgi:hydrogenase-4 component F